MEDCKTASTPMEQKQQFIQQRNQESDLHHPFRELKGCSMYLTVATSADIAFAANNLSQYNNCFQKQHWIAAKRVLRYLKGTISHGIVYKKNEEKLQGFVDADWASCTRDRRSYTGYVFTLSTGPVSWEARKQRTVASSSTESEYMTLIEATKEEIYWKNFLGESKLIDQLKVDIHNDNQGA